MKKFASAIVALGAALVLSACTSVLPMQATDNNVGSKEGRATATYLFNCPIFALPGSDASIGTAAKNGNIQKVGTVDVEVTWLLVMSKVTTIVHGE